MILDSKLFFGKDLDASQAAGTALLGDVIDLTALGYRPGMGEPLYIAVLCSQQIITGGAAGTIQFSLRSGSDAAISSDVTVHATSIAHLTDDATALAVAVAAGDVEAFENRVGGTLLLCSLPAGAYQRYLGIFYTVATTTTTAGLVSAFVTADVTQWRAFTDSDPGTV